MRHYMVKMTHIEGNEYMEERIPLKSVHSADAVRECEKYRQKHGYDLWRQSSPLGHGYWCQSANEKNTLRLRLK